MRVLAHLRRLNNSTVSRILARTGIQSSGFPLGQQIARAQKGFSGSGHAKFNQKFYILSALALGSITAQMMFVIYQICRLADNNSAINTVDDLERITELMDKLLTEHAPEEVKTSTKIYQLNRALLETIHKGNNQLFAQLLEDVFKIAQKPPIDYLKHLVNYAATHGKISILKVCLDDRRFSSVVRANSLATKLLKRTDGSEIEKVSEVFTQGPGFIRQPGINVQLSWAREQDLAAEERYQESRQYSSVGIFGICPVEDMSLMLSFVREQDALHRSLKAVDAAYANIVVLDGNDELAFFRYLATLKTAALTKSKSIDSKFILCGPHFTCGAIHVTPSNGKLQVSVLHIDSLGGYEIFNPHGWLVKYFNEVFCKDTVKHYISESQVQFASKGCSVFALNNIRDLGYFNQILALQAQHHRFLSAESPLFAYLDAHTTVEQSEGKESDKNGNEIFYLLKVVLLPLRFNVHKQSFGASGEIYLSEVKTRFAIGQMGLLSEIENTSPPRQEERHQPINPYKPGITFQDYLDKNTKRNARGKPQNMGNVLALAQWGIAIPSWLASKTPTEITNYKTAFSLDNLQKNLEIIDSETRELSDAKEPNSQALKSSM